MARALAESAALAVRSRSQSQVAPTTAGEDADLERALAASRAEAEASQRRVAQLEAALRASQAASSPPPPVGPPGSQQPRPSAGDASFQADLAKAIAISRAESGGANPAGHTLSPRGSVGQRFSCTDLGRELSEVDQLTATAPGTPRKSDKDIPTTEV